MCYEIPAKTVLANILLNHSEEVDVLKLGEVQRKIYNIIKKPLYVDITDDSVCAAVILNPELFQWSENNIDNITRAKGSDRYFTTDYIERFVNTEVPLGIRKALVEACE